MVRDIAQWLEDQGLGRYAQAFIEADVDLDLLPELSDDDLKDLGLSLGHRRRFLKAVAEAKDRIAPERGTTAERRQLSVFFAESRRGAVAWALWASLRFLSPLIKPDVRISRIRLPDRLHLKAHGGGPRWTRRRRITPNSPNATVSGKRLVPRDDTLWPVPPSP